MIRLILAAAAALALLCGAAAVPANYERAIANVLVHEGGYSNDRADPGGPTNWGITIYDVRKYLNPAATAADVQRLPKAAAIELYRTKYWAAVNADRLCAGLDYTVFDYGVNSGVVRAGTVLRRALELPTEDWRVSYLVLTAIGQGDCAQLIETVNDERLQFLRSLHTWPVFGKGWGKRVASVKAISLAMAGVHPLGLLPQNLLPARGPGKAYAVPGLDDQVDDGSGAP